MSIQIVPIDGGVVGVNNPVIIKLAADQTITDTTLVDITDFTFEVQQDKMIYFQFLVVYTSLNTASAILLSIDGPGSSQSYRGLGSFTTVAGGSGAGGAPDGMRNIGVDGLGQTVEIRVVPLVSQPWLATFEGIFRPTADGTFKLQGASTSTDDLTIRQGSLMFIWELE